MKTAIRISIFAIIFLYFGTATTSGQWINLAPALIQGIAGNQMITYAGDKIWVTDEFGYLWNSGDDGRTWQKVSTPISVAPTQFPGIRFTTLDFWDANNGIISGSIHNSKLDNVFLYTTSDGGISWNTNTLQVLSNAKYISSSLIVGSLGLQEIMLSIDGGITWKNISPQFPPSFTNIYQPNDIQVNKSNNSISLLILSYFDRTSPALIYHSKNFGSTWKAISTPYVDCWSMAVNPCNENLYYVMNEGTRAPELDSLGRVVFSGNSGETFEDRGQKPYRYYSASIICTERGILYCQTRSHDGIVRSTDRGLTWKSIGGPPSKEVDVRLICSKNDNTIFALGDDGSIWGTFNSGGDSILTENDLASISLTTLDKKTDTIGVCAMQVPITIKGLSKPSDVELVLHYDGAIDYLASFTTNHIKLDIPGEQWVGRSKLHFSNISDGDIGYSNFNFYSDKQEKQKVWFDSARIINVTLPCGTLSTSCDSAISFLSPPTACGSGIISSFMLTGRIFELNTYPNPAENSITVTSSEPITELTLFNGKGEEIPITSKEIHLTSSGWTIDIRRLTAGIYFLRAQSAIGQWSGKFVKE